MPTHSLSADDADVRDRYEREAREAAWHLQYALRLASKPIDGYTLHGEDAAQIAAALADAARLIASARLARTGLAH